VAIALAGRDTEKVGHLGLQDLIECFLHERLKHVAILCNQCF
jgi:hypothetical protein